jgi:hypothetical protein
MRILWCFEKSRQHFFLGLYLYCSSMLHAFIYVMFT